MILSCPWLWAGYDCTLCFFLFKVLCLPALEAGTLLSANHQGAGANYLLYLPEWLLSVVPNGEPHTLGSWSSPLPVVFS